MCWVRIICCIIGGIEKGGRDGGADLGIGGAGGDFGGLEIKKASRGF